ncbi:MAG TPA: type II toxin-antitoxin system VapC family toxin [Actinomycetota bacterium]|nr:type II toxin-antitoxin system VapC family toxin [Actinomycetota bacterium]
MLVVDTSAVLAALVGRPPDRRLLARLGDDGDLHAPYLLDVELLHVLRRLVATGRLTEDRAADARVDFADLVIVRYPHLPLADRIWALRHNLSAYDGAFVALSEALDIPLVTCDARLAGAPGNNAQIELFTAGPATPPGA